MNLHFLKNKINKKAYIVGSVIVLVGILSTWIIISNPLQKNEDDLIYDESAVIIENSFEYNTPMALTRADRLKSVEASNSLLTDGTKLYIEDTELQGIKLQDITFASGEIFADTKNVYLIDIYEQTAGIIKGLQAKNLRELGINTSLLVNDTQVYLVDGQFSRFFAHIANPSALRRIELTEYRDLFTDNIHVYVGNEYFSKLPIVSPKILDSSVCIKGTNTVFYDGSEIEDVDVNSFSLIPHISLQGSYAAKEDFLVFYAKDAKNVYYKGNIVPEADVQSFKSYPSRYYQDYAYDAKNVYYNGEIIKGADPVTFKILKEQPYEGCSKGAYGKDATAVYFKTKKVMGADPKTFEALLNEYGKDAKNLFWQEFNTFLSPEKFDYSLICRYG